MSKTIRIDWPLEGSAYNSQQMVLSKPLVQEFSRITGLSQRDADFFVKALGKVIHDRLLEGLPSGIPFVGVIGHIYKHNRRFSLKQARDTNSRLSNSLDAKIDFPVWSKVILQQPELLRLYFRDSAPYTGSINDHYRKNYKTQKELDIVNKRINSKRKPASRHYDIFRRKRNSNPKGNKYLLKIHMEKTGKTMKEIKEEQIRRYHERRQGKITY